MRDPVDPNAVLAALGVDAVAAVSPVVGGQDTAIWRVEHGGSVSALRVFRADQNEAFRREIIALTIAADAGLPVPTVRATGIWNGRPAGLIAWRPGRTLLDALSLNPSAAWPTLRAFGRMHARIHRISAPASLGESASNARLLHGDYHPMNVLVDGFGVSGVLDWVNVSTGDPRADLARTIVVLRLSPAPVSIGMRRLVEAAWRSGYASVSENGADAFANMAPFYAEAGVSTLADIREKTDRPDAARHIRRVARWTNYWKALTDRGNIG